MRLDQVGLQRDCGLIPLDRPRLLAEGVENVAETIVRGRDAGVEAKGGGKRPGRLFDPPGRQQGEAEVVVRRGYSRIELDRSLQQGDRLIEASLMDQAHAVAGKPKGFARRLCRDLREVRRPGGNSRPAGWLNSRARGQGIGGRRLDSAARLFA